jgi:histidinol-phosphate aminotransferase
MSLRTRDPAFVWPTVTSAFVNTPQSSSVTTSPLSGRHVQAAKQRSTIVRMTEKSMAATVPATRAYTPEDGVRPELKTMQAYTPILPYDVLAKTLGRAPRDIVKLDANENPYGPSPAALAALASADYIHIYPDPESGTLRDALEDYTGVSKEHIMAGAGADELIDLLFRLMITPGSGDSVVNLPPTFGMYKFDGDVNGAVVVNVPRSGESFAVDVDAVEALFADSAVPPPKMLFVASPNNPDGSVLTDAQLIRLLALPTLIVLDEAYFEFADDNRFQWVPRHNNLVVLRTFSKWAGLAGMRVGYGAFPLSIIKHLWKIKQPYNVAVTSQLAATASIHDKADLLGKVSRLVAQRVRFYKEVAALDWIRPLPSQSNYVLCRVEGGRTAACIKKELSDRGILVRYYTTPGIDDCIRISMGTDEQMERVYEALAEL